MSETPSGERPETAMDTGSEAGSPGERTQFLDAPDDEVGAAVADDAPLPPGQPEATQGGEQGDGLEPPFMEPADADT